MNAPLTFTPTDRYAQLSIDQRPWQLLLLSAKSATALDQAGSRLAHYIRTHPALNLADIAFTLQVGRRLFEHRRMLLCRDFDDAVQALEQPSPGQVDGLFRSLRNPELIFLFAGDAEHGGDYDFLPLQQLCAWSKLFRERIAQCLQQLPGVLNTALQPCLLAPAGQSQPMRLPAHAAHVLHFISQYALAGLWLSWGVKPARTIGAGHAHRIAACLDGSLSLAEALTAVLDDQSAPAPVHTAPAQTIDSNSLLLLMSSGERSAQPACRKLISSYAEPAQLLASLPDKVRHTDAVAFLLQTLGRLYFAGVSVDWQALYGEQRPRRVALPTYPFEHRRHWFRSGSATAADAAAPGATAPSQAQTQAQSFHARPEHLNNAYVAPRNIIEQILVDTCRELLGFERIGVCDNIVELGADSLFTMLLSRKVEQLFQLTISPHHLFSEPTLSSLAETIRAAGAVPDDAANQRQNRRNPALAGYLKILQNVEQMSDQQVDELLAQRAK